MFRRKKPLTLDFLNWLHFAAFYGLNMPVWDSLIYVMLGALLGLLIGFLINRQMQARFAYTLREANSRVEAIEEQAQKLVAQGYVSGFCDSAKYVVLSHGTEFTSVQRADILEKCKRVRESFG